MTASSPSSGATGYWPISAILTRTKTMPSEPCGPELDIIAAVAQLKTRAAEPLAVRIGIATGIVVVGGLRRRGCVAGACCRRGDAELAARLQALPSLGQSSSPASTRRLLGDSVSSA